MPYPTIILRDRETGKEVPVAVPTLLFNAKMREFAAAVSTAIDRNLEYVRIDIEEQHK